MREFKFRAFDTKYPEDEIFIPCLNEYIDINDAIWSLQFDGITFMQFTGLTDKNGVEIYEGDIISTGVDLWTVEYQKCCFCLICKDKKYILYQYWHYVCDDEFKVIGNIYENPELIQ